MRTTTLLIVSITALLSISTTTSNADQNNIENRQQSIDLAHQGQRSKDTSFNPECTICHEVIDPVAGSNRRLNVTLINANNTLTESDVTAVIAAIQ